MTSDSSASVSHASPRPLFNSAADASMAKILMLTPVISPGGNLATMNRIRHHLEFFGYDCELKSPRDFDSYKDYQSYILLENINVIIAIHALKTGAILKECPVPYILILGGSDVYVSAKDPAQLSVMSSAVHRARFIVSFSLNLKKDAQSLWPWMEEVKVKVIPQAVETLVPNNAESAFPCHLSESSLIGHKTTKRLWLSEDPEQFIIFVLIAGIRPVKDPLYLVPTFQEWHEQDQRILYMIVGHRLDAEYSKHVVEPEVCRKPGVLFIPGVSSADAHLFMQNSYAVLNSSVDEGMSLAILEAMQLKVPVIARRNPGNAAIVDDGTSGLLYDSEETFALQAKRLLNDPHLRNRLIQNAFNYIDTHHSVVEEKNGYANLVQQCLVPVKRDGSECS